MIPEASHGDIAAVTLTAANLDGATRAYQTVLGQRLISSHEVGGALAASWGASATAGRGLRVLQPPSGARCWLRLVESDPWPQGTTPRRSHGWAALELTVQNVEALHERLKDESHFRVLGPPAPLPGLPQICPMQAAGPMGEVLYLNEIRGDLPDHDLPRASCEIDHVFIVIVASPDLERSAEFYRDVLGFSLAEAYEIPYRMINDAFELPADTLHRLQTTSVGRSINVEIDQYPASATARAVHPGALPPAMAMVSFVVDDLSRFEAYGLGPVVELAGPPYFGRPALTLRGPAGELVEVIDRSGV